MANYSRWDEVKKKRRAPAAVTRADVEHELALGQLIYDLRTAVGLSQRELAERIGATQSVISRLEEGGGAKNRIDTLAHVAEALGRHLVVSFPEKVPATRKDAVQDGWQLVFGVRPRPDECLPCGELSLHTCWPCRTTRAAC